ncbi:hypothetical protein CYMTET_26798 [Cymbomonas tetramitiformis]|uniref:Uncharacterized protein n=1 Tax=Cymbomonas tetramitiformis TaxID=36881 RepID=A0AAE0FR24_9CHLO|nr:hypothetical protein CYMTET_26798 [Cymbomonas tetramitiformis]
MFCAPGRSGGQSSYFQDSANWGGCDCGHLSSLEVVSSLQALLSRTGLNELLSAKTGELLRKMLDKTDAHIKRTGVTLEPFRKGQTGGITPTSCTSRLLDASVRVDQLDEVLRQQDATVQSLHREVSTSRAEAKGLQDQVTMLQSALSEASGINRGRPLSALRLNRVSRTTTDSTPPTPQSPKPVPPEPARPPAVDTEKEEELRRAKAQLESANKEKAAASTQLAASKKEVQELESKLRETEMEVKDLMQAAREEEAKKAQQRRISESRPAASKPVALKATQTAWETGTVACQVGITTAPKPTGASSEGEEKLRRELAQVQGELAKAEMRLRVKLNAPSSSEGAHARGAAEDAADGKDRRRNVVDVSTESPEKAPAEADADRVELMAKISQQEAELSSANKKVADLRQENSRLTREMYFAADMALRAKGALADAPSTRPLSPQKEDPADEKRCWEVSQKLERTETELQAATERLEMRACENQSLSQEVKDANAQVERLNLMLKASQKTCTMTKEKLDILTEQQKVMEQIPETAASPAKPPINEYAIDREEYLDVLRSLEQATMKLKQNEVEHSEMEARYEGRLGMLQDKALLLSGKVVELEKSRMEWEEQNKLQYERHMESLRGSNLALLERIKLMEGETSEALAAAQKSQKSYSETLERMSKVSKQNAEYSMLVKSLEESVAEKPAVKK